MVWGGHSGWGAGKGTARAFSFVFRPIALAACQRLEKSRAISRQPRDSLPWGGGTWGGADVCRGPMAQGWRGRRRRTAGGPGGQRPASCCKRKKELTAQTRLIRETRTKSWQHFHVAVTNESGSHQHTTLFTLTFSSQTI